MNTFRYHLLILVCGTLLTPSYIFGQPQTNPPELVQAIQNAQSFLGQQKFSEAENEMLKATKKFARKPAAWYFLGYSRHAQKNFDGALAAYQKANQLANGQAPSTLYNMACIYAIKNQKDKAFEKLDAAIKAGFANMSHLQSDTDLTNLRSDSRFAKYKPTWLSDDQLFIEPTRIIQKWVGENAGDQFGWTARRVGDMDGDGVIDLIATAPTFQRNAGKIYVYSSQSGKLLHSVTGSKGDRLGNSAVGLGDLNGDKIPDFIAGAPFSGGCGAATVYSGKDASVIHHVKGTTSGAQFGYEVSELGDIDKDGTPDFLVGAMAGTGKVKSSGRVVAYSGRTAKVIFELKGENANDGFGNAAAAAASQNGTLLAIGAKNAGPNNRGRVYVYDIEDLKPSLKFTIEGDQNSVNLGQMFIAFPGDLNQDGIPDVYASDFSDKSKAAGGGKVVVHSGADGKELLAIHGTVAGEGLGTSPSDAGDVDGDGIGDLVVGAWQNAEGSASGGKVYLYSAAHGGRLLRSWTCKQSGDTLGFDACGIGDVDGDGFVDFLLTSAWSNAKGQKTGRVFIVAGEDYSKRKADPDSAHLKAGKVSTLLDDINAGTGGLNIDPQGRLYTADFGWRLDGRGKGGNLIHRVSQDGKSEVFSTKMRGASGNTFDSKGNLYQSSIGGNFISKIAPDGTVTDYCKEGLRSPVGLAFNGSGELFACNCGSNSIQSLHHRPFFTR